MAWQKETAAPALTIIGFQICSDWQDSIGGRLKVQGLFTNSIIQDEDDKLIEIQQRALDDIVNVNSLFTMAVFVGLAFASPGQHSLGNRPECDADSGVAKRLITYEVVSFAFFLLSSLTAKTLKVQLHIHRFKIKISFMKYKIRLGKLSCGSVDAIQAVAYLCAVVLIALAI
ncbi:hypothetical protein PTKIN_Ptkin01aG0291300 [Pterospermum kingtungense]